jgi:hypothetical protein
VVISLSLRIQFDLLDKKIGFKTLSIKIPILIFTFVHKERVNYDHKSEREAKPR